MTRCLLVLHFYLLLFTWSTSPTENSQPIREQLLQLGKKYDEIKEMLAAKDTSKLEETVARLEGKISRLEVQVRQQDLLLSALHDKQLNFFVDKSVVQTNQSTARKAIFRSCQDIFNDDSEMKSGWYWIDPDGHDIGDNPIYVYCNTNSVQITTSIPHDSEAKIDVLYCLQKPGCYSRNIFYNATMRQMIALAELSNECHQAIKYNCIDAPFEFDGEQYSWWNDRNGNPQFFWSGNANSVHRCECGIDGRCININKKCNCDSGLSVPLSDNGIIQAKDLLPVTQLRSGRTIGSGQFTLGRFECTGRVEISGMPRSCMDLWRIGHTLSGLYSVKGSKSVEAVYCDFSKLHNDQEFQTWIGHEDVKSSPVYFYVQRGGNFDSTFTPIPFSKERLNIGGSMNLTNGKFTAPRTGIYFFSLSGTAAFPTRGKSFIDISLKWNGNSVGLAEAYLNTGEGVWQTYSMQSTLPLKAGDQIWLEIISKSNSFMVDVVDYHFTHFIGFLLQEDIA